MKGVVIAGIGSGVGKTSIATGLMARLSKRYKVQAFKCGPDFIDPMYHSAATGRMSRNLDSFLMTDETIRNTIGYASRDADISIVEGVRGLYEGFEGDGEIGSTAHISKILGFPVILVMDVGSLTRSAAAILRGFKDFDPEIDISGVILNNVSGKQHSEKLGVAMRTYCGDVDVLGEVIKNRSGGMKQGRMGLPASKEYIEEAIKPLENLAEPVDLDLLMEIAENHQTELPSESPYFQANVGAKIAIPRDDAFAFYYPDNIECLEASGFRTETFSPVAGDMIPDADALYLGGGYPEFFAKEISENSDFLEGVRNMSSEGKPILGECGGMTVLCETATDADRKSYQMAGVFDANADYVDKRHGPTYVLAQATKENPLFTGDCVGHEYHYSEVHTNETEFGFRVNRGIGIANGMDGMIRKNSVGTYMHQHALSYGDWAKGFRENLQ